MTDMDRASVAYRNTAVQTAAPDRLLLMLYDGLIQFLEAAKRALVEGRRADAHAFLLRSQDILRELTVTLKMDYEISHSLAALYDYYHRRLVEANVTKDPVPVEEVLEQVRELREAWANAALALRQASVRAEQLGSI
ncbi:flagellar export chaperone FliS [Kyrpidia tusciae]|uniref:Flagellar secretion chaperone FliS n=1 Tax=Kyrpidia tusciae (strain DSM 2912 / NBRC 15312 / T2) TaxID=562970 RepID=D5WUZ5_KYRT2|nr:flagellar export chaperone FliS [Kyrpidia tusciae]ADG07467.1 flagellar protein FliS [Kyrpidia tusciae DSM 2912]